MGRVLGGLVLLAALSACPGGEVAADTEGTGAASGSGDSGSGPEPSGLDGSGSDAGECPAGRHGCPCIAGGGCDEGLVCEGGTCESSEPTCGNGRVEGDEQCDLGDALDDAGECKTDCTLASCGDGRVGPGEACDDGNLIPHDGCTNACKLPACGDGVLHDGEQCDDGNTVDADACTNACTEARCGDGVLHDGEECDDGNTVDTDECTNRCHPPSCGDGVTSDSEPCDDGNTVDTDACIDCVAAFCGDGHRRAGVEDCDGTALGGATCASQGFMGGTLTCTRNCTFDTAGCTMG